MFDIPNYVFDYFNFVVVMPEIIPVACGVAGLAISYVAVKFFRRSRASRTHADTGEAECESTLVEEPVIVQVYTNPEPLDNTSVTALADSFTDIQISDYREESQEMSSDESFESDLTNIVEETEMSTISVIEPLIEQKSVHKIPISKEILPTKSKDSVERIISQAFQSKCNEMNACMLNNVLQSDQIKSTQKVEAWLNDIPTAIEREIRRSKEQKVVSVTKTPKARTNKAADFRIQACHARNNAAEKSGPTTRQNRVSDSPLEFKAPPSQPGVSRNGSIRGSDVNNYPSVSRCSTRTTEGRGSLHSLLNPSRSTSRKHDKTVPRKPRVLFVKKEKARKEGENRYRKSCARKTVVTDRPESAKHVVFSQQEAKKTACPVDVSTIHNNTTTPEVFDGQESNLETPTLRPDTPHPDLNFSHPDQDEPLSEEDASTAGESFLTIHRHSSTDITPVTKVSSSSLQPQNYTYTLDFDDNFENSTVNTELFIDDEMNFRNIMDDFLESCQQLEEDLTHGADVPIGFDARILNSDIPARHYLFRTDFLDVSDPVEREGEGPSIVVVLQGVEEEASEAASGLASNDSFVDIPGTEEDVVKLQTAGYKRLRNTASPQKRKRLKRF